MTTNHPVKSPDIKRILLASSSSPISDDLIESAILLASNLQADLMGLLIEDIKLLHLASLPIAGEVIYGARNRRKLKPESVERSFKIEAQRFRERLERRAKQAHIHCSVSITRGELPDQILSLISSNDLVVLGRNNDKHRSLRNQQAQTHTLLTQASCSVALLKQGSLASQSIMVLFDKTMSAKRALLFAIKLALATKTSLSVILPALRETDSQHLQQQAYEITQDYQLPILFFRLADNHIETLFNLINARHGQLLIFDTISPHWSTADQQQLIDAAKCPVVFFR